LLQPLVPQTPDARKLASLQGLLESRSKTSQPPDTVAAEFLSSLGGFMAEQDQRRQQFVVLRKQLADKFPELPSSEKLLQGMSPVPVLRMVLMSGF
jgi:hypothetical protein